jgi:DNA-binding beta-propeller fold protein YncE
MDEARFRDELRRYWDEIARDGRAVPGQLDLDLVAVIRRLHAARDVAPPDPAYARRLRAQLIAADSAPLPLTPASQRSPNGHAGPQPGWSQQALPSSGIHRPWGVGPLAVAALFTLILLIGLAGAWLLFRPQPITVNAPEVSLRFDFLWSSTGGPEVLVQPQGLAVDPQGNLWVVDSGNDRFQIFAPDGTFLETWGASGAAAGEFDFAAGQKGGAGDIAFDDQGSFYVVDTGNHRIQKFSPDRAFLHGWGSEGDGDGQFMTARYVAVSPDGSVYVCDEVRRDVQKFDADGRFLLSLDTYELGEGTPSTADSVAVDGQGFVWVADQSNFRISRFSPDGAFLNGWGVRGTRPGELFRPTDLAIGNGGVVYVADRSIKRIQLFASDGRFLGETRADPKISGGFVTASTIGVGPDGTGYISSEYSIHAFRIFGFSGAGPMP